jgi:hypothetical protein
VSERRLSDEQLDGMDMWDRDVMLDERHRAAGAMLVRAAVAEIRQHRARIAAHALAHPERLPQSSIDEIAACGDGAVLEDVVDGDEIGAMAIECQQRRAADLTPDQHADLRRVRQIIIHLDRRQSGEWGDPLTSAIEALDAVIRG